MSRISHFISLLVVLALLGGCAIKPQNPVPLESAYWAQSDRKVGLLVHSIDKPEFYIEGGAGLLDLAIIQGVMGPLYSHLESLNTDELADLGGDLSKLFETSGNSLVDLGKVDLEALPSFEDPNDKDTTYYARRDYRSLKKKYKVDQVLVLEQKRLGVARAYHGFIPMGAPRSVFEMAGSIVDLSDNQLIWYSHPKYQQGAGGEWDEPPAFPGLTNAYYSVIAQMKQAIIDEVGR